MKGMTMEFSKYLTDDERPYGTYWKFEFPNGHEASIVVDKRPEYPFRFEILSTDPGDNGAGHIVVGLTTDEVETKLAKLAGLERHEDAA
jgi:hypothetical protein